MAEHDEDLNTRKQISKNVIWECYTCGNWELSAENVEPPECAASHGDMVNRFAGSDKPMSELELLFGISPNVALGY